MAVKLSQVWEAVEAAAKAEGALRVGAASLEDLHAEVFEQWLERGHEAGMSYLRKNRRARLSPTERFPWANSVIVISVAYPAERSTEGLEANIARYALGDDYHLVLDKILRAIEEKLQRICPEIRTRRYVDTGPLSDRAYGAQAGLGWIGKNSMLIDPEHGSWIFIGTLLTSLQNDMRAEEVADRCGNCTRCIDACPTEAILPDRTVASQRCISYATIEHRGAIEDAIKERLGENLFGCDICNEVCPWNEVPADAAADFRPRAEYRARPISDLLRMSQADFSRLFHHSAVKRAKRAGLIRNAVLIVPDLPADALEALRAESDSGIADAVAWRRNH